MSFSSPMQKMQYDALVEMIEEHNGLVAKINAATGDRDSLADSIRESDEFAETREQIAKLTEQLNAAVQQRVEEALNNATGDTEALQTDAKEKKSTITSGLSYYKKLYGEPEGDHEFPKVDRVKGQRSGGGGGGGRRVRGYNVVVTMANGEATEFENFATAAKFLAVDTSDLQEQFFSKAGVEKLKDAPDEVSFGLSWNDVDEDGTETPNSATVKAYRTGPSGPPTVETTVDEPESTQDTEVDEGDLEEL